MWPMVPVVHMIYRLWQLGRGSVLVAALHGPAYLQHLQVPFAKSPACTYTSDSAGLIQQLFRVLTLQRGTFSGILDAEWLCVGQAILAVIWVLNFGAVMAWMPWLYRWHLQPKSTKN